MSGSDAARPAAGQGVVAACLFLLLLVLPFHPFWTDAEQVRRGLLLVLAGAVLLASRTLPRLHGERAMLVFGGVLAASGVINLMAQVWFGDAGAPVSFQPWDAAYRLAHWLAVWIVLRFAARTPAAAALPMAAALALTSALGLVQRLGLGEVEGYGSAREPVSTLGNLNVAAEWTAVAAMVVAVLLPATRGSRLRWLSLQALVLAGAYAVVNGSRSGLIALPVGLAALALLRRRDGVLPLALAAAGGLLGLGIAAIAPRPAAVDTIAATAELQRGTKTLEVRIEIAKSTGKLVARSPVVGHGPGQFAVLYPTVRSENEIELSSHGRKFVTEVRTAHDDWLELLVDGGAPALLAFAVVLFVLQRRQTDKARLLPLFVLLLLMLVRAPLWNAPAVVAALWLVGVPVVPQPAVVPWRRIAMKVLGVALLVLGVLPVAANQAFAPYLRARRLGAQPPMAAVTDAASWTPFEPRWLQALAQEHLFAGNLQQATRAARRARELRPFHPEHYTLLGEIAARGNNYADAAEIARFALDLDPPNPELRVLLSTALALQQKVDPAIDAVVESPHAMLRAQLAQHFRALAAVCRARGDTDSALRFDAEHHFVAAIDLFGRTDAGSLAAAKEHVAGMLNALTEAGRGRADARPFVVSALHALDLGRPEMALEIGDRAQQEKLTLQPWQRALLGDKLAPLRSFAPWQSVVGP